MELRVFTDILNNMQQTGEFEDVLKNIYLTELPELDSTDGVEEILQKTMSEVGNFCAWSWHQPFNWTVLGETEDFWEESIRAQCIVSASYTLENTLFRENETKMTARDLVKNFKRTGLLAARRDGKIRDNCKTKSRTETLNRNEDTENGNYASAAISAIRKKMTDEEYETYFMTERKKQECQEDRKSNSYVNDIRLSEWDVLDILLECRELRISKSAKKEGKDRERRSDYFAKKLHKLYDCSTNGITASEYVDYFDKACQEAIGPIPRDKDQKEEKLDFLIKIYKLERYYNFSLNKSILSCVVLFSKRNGDFLKNYIGADGKDGDFLELLVVLSELPNVFTRDIMCSWLFSQLERALEIRESGKSFDEVFRQWLKKSKEFVYYLSKIVFPMAEKMFLSLLIKKYSIEDGDSIWKCMDDLLDYIGTDRNYLEIIEPCLTFRKGSQKNKTYLRTYTFNKEIQASDEAKSVDRASFNDEIRKRSYSKEYDQILIGNYTSPAWYTEIKGKRRCLEEYNYGLSDNSLSDLKQDELESRAKDMLCHAGADYEIIRKDSEDKKNQNDKHRLELRIVKVRKDSIIDSGDMQKKVHYTDLLSDIVCRERSIVIPSSGGTDVFERDWLNNIQHARRKILDIILEAGLKEWTNEGRNVRAMEIEKELRDIVVAPGRE